MRKLLFSSVAVAAASIGFAFAPPDDAAPGPPAPKSAVGDLPLPEAERGVNEAAQAIPSLVYGPLREDLSRDVTWRHQAVGKKVRVEGIAWGQTGGKKGEEGTISPHAGPKVLYEGGGIFVPGVDLAKEDARGKTVRVVGTLRLEPEGRTSWGKIEKWYYVEPETFEVIDRVVDPVPVLVGEG